MELEIVAIDEIVRNVRRVVQPDKIILFGSAASGNMTRDSDIDLLVVMPSCPNTIMMAIQIRRALDGLAYPFDIIVMETARFEETKNIIGGISYPANKYGKVIYENSG